MKPSNTFMPKPEFYSLSSKYIQAQSQLTMAMCHFLKGRSHVHLFSMYYNYFAFSSLCTWQAQGKGFAWSTTCYFWYIPPGIGSGRSQSAPAMPVTLQSLKQIRRGMPPTHVRRFASMFRSSLWALFDFRACVGIWCIADLTIKNLKVWKP